MQILMCANKPIVCKMNIVLTHFIKSAGDKNRQTFVKMNNMC